MNDSEIITWLKDYATHFDNMYLKEALDLINRQQTTICDLTYKVDLLETSLENMITGATIAIDVERTKAVREFAKFLIDKSDNGVISISDIPDFVIEIGNRRSGNGT